ncbi:MAG TPA: hypothetical protein DDZ51_22070 [Planctomycetaceae bacterium]|nr:hypothetical protein [Planctomycetaceae bacterium]
MNKVDHHVRFSNTLRLLEMQNKDDASPQSTMVLTREIAETLICDNESIHANEYTSINEDAAVLIGASGKLLFLDGLKTLPADLATVLSTKSTIISLNGLLTLDDETAKVLGKSNDSLYLCGLTSLSVVAASEIAKVTGSELFLDGLPTISEDVATSLARFQGERESTLSLDGLTKISAVVAAELKNHRGWLSLQGLTDISDDAALQLGKHDGENLYLSSVDNLSDAAIQSLAHHSHSVWFGNLPEDQKNRFEEMVELKKFMEFAWYARYVFQIVPSLNGLPQCATNMDELVEELQSGLDCDDVVYRTRQLRDLLNRLDLTLPAKSIFIETWKIR